MKSGVMTLSVVSPRRRSMPAPRERNGVKELTACEGVTSTTMLFGGAPRCAKVAAGESKTIAPQRLRFVENMLLLRRPSGRLDPLESGSLDRKSTRLNSSHLVISYAVFCLKKKQE